MKIKPSSARTKKTPKRITADYLHNSGLYYLQRFSASSGQFHKVMMRKVMKSCAYHKDQNPDDAARLVDALVAKFIAGGLLNDGLYTRGAVHSLRRAGKSRQVIMARLSQKGIDKSLIAESISAFDAEYGDDDPEYTAALTFVQKKKLRTRPPQKALAALARAGFSYDLARRVLDVRGDEEDFKP